MKRALLPLLPLAIGAAVLGAPRHASPRAHEAVEVLHSASASGTLGLLAKALPARRTSPVVIRDIAGIRRRLRSDETGTYIGDILEERDSALVRWPDRHGRPLLVWIQPTSPVTDFAPRLADQVRDAFIEWNALELPVTFSFMADSASADVHVTWIDHFVEPISGRTRWARDDAYFMTDANVILAVHHNRGEALDDDAMRAMALHEIGHVLGLDHTRDVSSIMAPRVRVRALSDADRATARLIYSLPAGPVR